MPRKFLNVARNLGIKKKKNCCILRFAVVIAVDLCASFVGNHFEKEAYGKAGKLIVIVKRSKVYFAIINAQIESKGVAT